jgi:hypothetical protein
VDGHGDRASHRTGRRTRQQDRSAAEEWEQQLQEELAAAQARAAAAEARAAAAEGQAAAADTRAAAADRQAKAAKQAALAAERRAEGAEHRAHLAQASADEYRERYSRALCHIADSMHWWEVTVAGQKANPMGLHPAALKREPR